MTNLKKHFGNKFFLILALMLALTACGTKPAEEPVEETTSQEEPQAQTTEETTTEEGMEESKEPALPSPYLDENAEAKYALDNASITVENFDQYMNRSDVLYIDIRDYNDYAIKHFKNFEVIPYFGYLFNPEANTNPEMIQLYGGSPEEPIDVYEESDAVLKALFPQDQTIFLLCEKGGRVTQLMQILAAKGYDMNKIYNIGGMGQYTDAKYKDAITDAYELTLDASYGFEGLTRK